MKVVAGAGAENAGCQNGIGTEALFYYPIGIVFNAHNNHLYIGGNFNHCIRQINLTNGNYARSLTHTSHSLYIHHILHSLTHTHLPTLPHHTHSLT